LLADRQTDKHGQKRVRPPLSEVFNSSSSHILDRHIYVKVQNSESMCYWVYVALALSPSVPFTLGSNTTKREISCFISANTHRSLATRSVANVST